MGCLVCGAAVVGSKWVAVQGVRAVELGGRAVGSLVMQMAGGAVVLSKIFSKMFQGGRAAVCVKQFRLLVVRWSLSWSISWWGAAVWGV
jgi:hypothetical protein